MRILTLLTVGKSSTVKALGTAVASLSDSACMIYKSQMIASKYKNNGSRRGYKMPSKTHWHLYSLQALNCNKFIQVVNKVLRREFFLIK